MYINLFKYNFRYFTCDLHKAKDHELRFKTELRTGRENRNGKQLIFTGGFLSEFL